MQEGTTNETPKAELPENVLQIQRILALMDIHVQNMTAEDWKGAGVFFPVVLSLDDQV